MFSGIITDIGTIQSYEKKGNEVTLVIETNLPLETYNKGASIACSGVCLTVNRSDIGHFRVDISAETFKLTNAPEWKEGYQLNLESSLRMGDEISGHMVFGHVDTQAEIISIKDDGSSKRLVLRAPDKYKKFFAIKGSITLNGISLTVNEVNGNTFGVNIIPHTWKHTTLSNRKVGDTLNLEVDMLARYVDRMINPNTEENTEKGNNA